MLPFDQEFELRVPYWSGDVFVEVIPFVADPTIIDFRVEIGCDDIQRFCNCYYTFGEDEDSEVRHYDPHCPHNN